MRNNVWTDKLEDIRKVFASQLTDAEFEFMVGLGKATGLDPFRKEIWCVKYGNSPAQVFIGRDGYRMIALSHPDYDYHQSDSVYENDDFKVVNGEIHHTYSLKDRGKIVGAYCITKRKSASKSVYYFVKFSEYNSGKSLWASKPDLMIRKCAEANALRASFQDVLGGTYIPEEMPEEMHQKEEKSLFKAEIKEEFIPVNEYQLEELKDLLLQKDIQSDRIKKALHYYQIEEFSELSEKQAQQLIERWAAL